MRRLAAAFFALSLVATACGGGADDASAGTASPTTAAVTSSTFASEVSTTTTTIPELRIVDIAAEPPPWEDIELTTSDEVTLEARLWSGDARGVIVGHFANRTADAGTSLECPEGAFCNDIDNWMEVSGAFANEGYTVLAISFRNHGRSGGDYDLKAAPTDLEAAYLRLFEEDVSEVYLVGIGFTGTAGIIAEASGLADFDAMVMAWTPAQFRGLDSLAVVAEVDTPMYFIAIEAGTSQRNAKLIADRAQDSRGLYVFPSVPAGQTFGETFLGEMVGYMFTFLEGIQSENTG
ncbi:MAG: alpha/beta hydrolase [Acidimicrobiia bacterium]|nr:alpha/beta hydrolase [Acidimicrobiia bacterium]